MAVAQCFSVRVAVLVLVVISTPHSPAGTAAPDAMRVERAGTFAQAFREGLR